MAADTTAQKYAETCLLYSIRYSYTLLGNANGILTIRARAIQRQPTRLQRQPMSFPAKRQQSTTLHPTRAIVVILERLLLVSLDPFTSQGQLFLSTGT